jgi:hypothetical protein
MVRSERTARISDVPATSMLTRAHQRGAIDVAPCIHRADRDGYAPRQADGLAGSHRTGRGIEGADRRQECRHIRGEVDDTSEIGLARAHEADGTDGVGHDGAGDTPMQ